MGFASFARPFFILRSTEVAKIKKQEKAPKSCQSCKHWSEVSKKLRVGGVLDTVIANMETNLQKSEFKASLGDYLKLLQLEKEIGEDGPKEIKVTWVEPDKSSTEP
ncbi:MAG: hypothetical protein ABI759_25425 [Candidatus Solibacter sp.]